MNIFPCSVFGRVLSVLWLAACIAVLVFAFMRRDIRDTDIAVAWFMIYLAFPIGYGLTALLSFLFMLLYESFGLVVPGGFVFNLLSWLVFVTCGYFQWFMLVPWAYRRVRKSSNRRLETGAP